MTVEFMLCVISNDGKAPTTIGMTAAFLPRVGDHVMVPDSKPGCSIHKVMVVLHMKDD